VINSTRNNVVHRGRDGESTVTQNRSTVNKDLTVIPSPDQIAPLAHGIDAERLVKIFLSNKSDRTIAAYKKDLTDFARFLGIDDGNLDHAARRFLSNGRGGANALAAEYRGHMEAKRLSPATINRRLSALRSMSEQAGTLGLVAWELRIKGIKSEPYRDTQGPGTRNVGKMLGLVEGRKKTRNKKGDQQEIRTNPKAIRDFAILRLLYDLALRRGEVVSLDVGDVDLEGRKIKVKGKGRAEKEILALPAPTAKALADWIKILGDSDGPLFVNFDRAKKGNRLTGAAVYYVIRKLGKEIGITTRPHGLRHSAITACVEQFPLTEVQKFSRHKKIETVAVYADNKEGVQSKIADFVSATA
jgi:integrase/recombinase XerC